MEAITDLPKVLKPVGLDIAQDIYEGSSDKYIVYNLTTATPDSFADDVATTKREQLYVHLFVPRKFNFINCLSNIKKCLTEHDYSYPTLVLNTIENNNVTRHICLATELISNLKEE